MSHSRAARTGIAVLTVVTLIGAGEDGARERVASGVRKYQRRDYRDAAKDFADADVLAPNNAHIQFNRGCAESHDTDNRDGARGFFRSAATAKDPQVAAAAQYNLGCLEAREAEGLLDGYAEGLDIEEREQVVATLNKSMAHYRDCLRIDPEHGRARRNMEVVKLFLSDLRKKWAELDRKRRPQKDTRQAEPLVRMLDQLDTLQSRALELSHAATTEPINVPPSAYQAGQVRVNDRIPELREATEADLGSNSNDGLTEDQLRQSQLARELLGRQTDEFERRAQAALKKLAAEHLTDAIPDQAAALEPINAMYELVAKFPDAVFRSLRIQRATHRASRLNVNAQKSGGTVTPNQLLAERQNRVASMARTLADRAERFEQTLAAAEQKAANGQPTPNMSPETIAGYRTAIQRATEMAPELADVTTEATNILGQEDIFPVLQKQTRALQILLQIAETMPNQQNEQSKQDKEKKEQEQNKNQPTADEDRGEVDPNKQRPGEERKKKEQEIRSREEAEAMLRKVRDYEQSQREMKAMLRARARRARVERDW